MSQLLQDVVGEFSKLPGVGRRTALRLAMHLLKMEPWSVADMTRSIDRFRNEVKHCVHCNNLSDAEVCPVCADEERDRTTICVVEQVADVLSIENTRQYRGLYHVLGGVISPMQGIGPADLKIDLLCERLERGEVKEVILDYTRRLGLAIGIVGLFNIQFIVDEQDQVYLIEVNPRSSRTVPFLSKATGCHLADIATLVMLGRSLKDQGILEMYPKERSRYYVKVPAFSFSKLDGMDAYLSPEMKSTGEAIGYDKKLHRAMYKAMIASGMTLNNYGTVMVTLADEDKEEALPLIRRFYHMGFNIEATVGTADFLKERGIRTRIRRKLSEGSQEILESIRAGYVSYVINTRAILSGVHYEDGAAIRRCASQNGVTMLTSLDTVKVLLDVLEEVTIGVSVV